MKFFNHKMLDVAPNKKVVNPSNIVFSGGGIKGIAYCGAIQALSDLKLMDNITKYAGASAGAIMALLLAIGMTPEQVTEQMNKVDFATFLQKSNVNIAKLAKNPKELLDPFIGAKVIYDEVEHRGLCDVSVFYAWLIQMLKIKGFDEKTTFSDLHGKTGKELDVAICNTNYGKTVIANYLNTPDMPVALAVRGSMSIPLVFQPMIWQNDVYVDGGTMYNYPIEVFDQETEPDKTIGFILSTENEVLNPVHKPNGNIIEHIERLLASIMNVSYEYCFRLGNQYRTIFIDPAGITTLQFDLTPEQKKTLMDNGYKAAMAYFSTT